MTRRLWIVLSSLAVAASLGVSVASCNNPTCGPGTSQVQQSDGKLVCTPTEGYAGDTHCDIDAGNVLIQGGQCISAIKCDPLTTTVVAGVCKGTGGTTLGCSTPALGKSCVTGRILDFKTNMPPAAGTMVHVQLWEATTLLSGGMPITQSDFDASKGYVFQDFMPPQLGLIVILTGDGTNQVLTGTGGQGISKDNSYTIDSYTIPKAQADGWGFNYTAGGAYIAKFYKDAKPTSPTSIIANETMPATGVQITKDTGAGAMVAAGQQFFDDTLTMVDPMLTSTGASGVAIVASPIAMGGSFPTFSGTGGGIPAWESFPGGSKGMTATNPPVVIITRFHPN